MCGKFTALMTWGEYVACAGVGTDGGAGGDDPMPAEKDLGTFTPMAMVPVLHLGPVRQRRISPMRWGWHDENAMNPLRTFKKDHLHARSETIDVKQAWRESFHERRGVVFTKQFNIGESLPNGKTQQWQCWRPGNQPMALAVIFNAWQLVQGPLRTLAMVTTASCYPLNEKDDRMPAILRDDHEVALWLGELGATPDELKALLRPYPDGELLMRPQGAPPKPKPPSRSRTTPQPGLF
ncbi:MAG TPA: SOS response-associated peptidase family protein [Rhizomicrobium sp.]|jgi:putative SOS response-associated peptidase YedK